jgi:glycosyltransferase involved in cell wall biosynthesis
MPNSIDVVEALSPRTVIYHCIDDYAEFTGAPREAFARMERRLLARADLTVVSSRRLLELKQGGARRISYVPHGVDAEFFATSGLGDVLPGDMPGIGKPVAGFVGRIGDWIDLELVISAAKSLPDWSFVLIGPATVDLSPLEGLANVHILGRKDYEQIPNYIRRFDVALMPFRSSKLVDSVNPLKLYEYLATGTPVVSVPMVEINDLGPELVTFARPGEFAEAIERARSLDRPEWRSARLTYARKRSWASIADTILARCDEAST